MENRPPLYERQEWDTPTSWALFEIYRDQALPRSLTRAYNRLREIRHNAKGGGQEGAKGGAPFKPAKRPPGSVRSLAAGKNRDGTPRAGAVPFTLRIQAYEQYIDSLEREKWVKRRKELRESEYEIGTQILDKTKDMLLFPVMVQETAVSEDGQSTTVIMPAGWSFKDIPGMLNTASKIARLATELPTGQIKVDWRKEAAKDGIDPDDLQRELVDQILARMDGASASGGDDTSADDPEAEEKQTG